MRWIVEKSIARLATGSADIDSPRKALLRDIKYINFEALGRSSLKTIAKKSLNSSFLLDLLEMK
jgi:hypothetical protein